MEMSWVTLCQLSCHYGGRLSVVDTLTGPPAPHGKPYPGSSRKHSSWACCTLLCASLSFRETVNGKPWDPASALGTIGLVRGLYAFVRLPRVSLIGQDAPLLSMQDHSCQSDRLTVSDWASHSLFSETCEWELFRFSRLAFLRGTGLAYCNRCAHGR